MRAASLTSAAALLVALAAAQPAVLEPRAYETVTRTVIETKYVDVTVMVPNPTAHPYGGAGGKKANPHHGHAQAHKRPPHRPAGHKHKKPKPAQAPPAPVNTSPPAQKPAPKPAAPKPKPAAPKPKPAAPKPAAKPQSAPSGEAHTGELTHYTPSMGSCGFENTSNEPVVALAVDFMNNPANPNSNPKCGQYISIVYGGKTTKAKIVDTCQACATYDLDVSESLFTQVAPNGDGRVYDVKWYM